MSIIIENTNQIVSEYNIPFKCLTSGNISFPFQMLRDLVVIFPLKEDIENKLSKTILIPENVIDENLLANKKGIILNAGKGYFNNKGNWISNPYKAGMLVSYNNSVMWRLEAKDSYDEIHSLPYMTFGDIFYLLK